MKVKKGDTVLIITGKDKGKKGKVLTSLPQERKLIVEGLNIVKKHRRPRRSGEKGQVVEAPKPLDISNVKLICSRCGQAARVGYKITGAEKFRVCKKCQSEI
ncbi:MAG: 50S ribosomal protein L24 [Candidatus Portnoybacteria bacterium]|nr:50S ribosomal protein L24 [Candidatus Portnoybacteria bacterium]